MASLVRRTNDFCVTGASQRTPNAPKLGAGTPLPASAGPPAPALVWHPTDIRSMFDYKYEL
jgi:hypothetical protein